MTKEAMQRITIPDIVEMKAAGKKITMLTAYDFLMAELLDDAELDMILVGDSLAMVVQGRDTTLPVTLDQMIYHAEMVGRAVKHALVVVDMPFLSFNLGIEKTLESAGRVLKETACQAVKLEAGPEQAETIQALTSVGIPVMAHVGLRPQSVLAMGRYRVQRDKSQLIATAKAAESSGAFSIVLECIPVEIAEEITSAVSVPTIGIGSGPGCDGQVLVTHDVLGLFDGFKPRFVKHFSEMRQQSLQGLKSYCREVREGIFPDDEHSFR